VSKVFSKRRNFFVRKTQSPCQPKTFVLICSPTTLLAWFGLCPASTAQLAQPNCPAQLA
jgi:hypothetical protein